MFDGVVQLLHQAVKINVTIHSSVSGNVTSRAREYVHPFLNEIVQNRDTALLVSVNVIGSVKQSTDVQQLATWGYRMRVMKCLTGRSSMANRRIGEEVKVTL